MRKKQVLFGLLAFFILSGALIVLLIILDQNNASLNPFVVKAKPAPLKRYSNTLIEFPVEQNTGDIHYRSNKISFSFNNKTLCGKIEPIRVRRAFLEIENQTNRTLIFIEVDKDSDIDVNCFRDVPLAEKRGYILFGNAAFKNMGELITKGEINLYNTGEYTRSPGCANFPDIEIHEILHTFGIGHIDNSSSIMLAEYNRCKYKIDPEILNYLVKIYANLSS